MQFKILKIGLAVMTRHLLSCNLLTAPQVRYDAQCDALYGLAVLDC